MAILITEQNRTDGTIESFIRYIIFISHGLVWFGLVCGYFYHLMTTCYDGLCGNDELLCDGDGGADSPVPGPDAVSSGANSEWERA
jgi:hypothetical protein